MNKINLGIVVIMIGLTGCGESTQYRGSDFSALDSCMAGIERWVGQSLKVVIDKPSKVTGVQSNGTFWACEKKSTGTKGTYWEGYYTVKK